MKSADDSKARERKGVCVFTACCFASLAYVSLIALVVNNGGHAIDPSAFPAVVWHVLDIGIDVMFIVLGFGVAWMLVFWPSWQLMRRGNSAGMASLGAGIKPLQIAVIAAIGTSFFTVPTIGVVWVKNSLARPTCYQTYEEFDKLSSWGFMLPEGTSDIKQYQDCGFGYQVCDISCRISRETLDEFAQSHGYHFERRDWLPSLAESCVTHELYPLDDDVSRYLYCRARENNHAEGNLVYIYDCKAERLYASYHN